MSGHDDLNWLSEFARIGAVWRHVAGGPHAAYELEACHSDFYFNTDIVAAHAPVLNFALRELIARNQLPSMNASVFTFHSRLRASLVMSGALAALLNAPVHSLDLETGLFTSEPRPNARGILFADDVYTGGSLRALSRRLSSLALKADRILTLANFSEQTQIDGVPIQALFKLQARRWTPDQCPLCRSGSKPLRAREYWGELTASNAI